MSCDIYMALSCMRSILKVHGVSSDSTVGEMPLPLKASQRLLVFVTQGLSVALSTP